MKRISTRNPAEVTDCEDVEMLELESGSPNVPETVPLNPLMVGTGRVASYRDTLQRNNPNLEFETRENPIWDADGFDAASEDDEPPEEDDPTCLTILLTTAEKQMLCESWRNAALANMDLNIEVEPITESEETQGDKEDYMPQLEGTILDSGINEDNMEKERLGTDTPSALGEENVPRPVHANHEIPWL
ncbi:hypothetical protein Cgig2_007568 [Carnegiea gigantea]|uniref:Uncharacterized protein n=1 Tax=Carnegiea gigantea TaxID=171969 RepID=A0A9Q1GNZ0_9CARY|nr:hypothetical protein Cgig2_007568 [Carnegiea gigantea]